MSLPKPYYQDESVTIYHGDNREILPHLGTFDLLLTDPPYGIGEAAGKAKSRTRKGVTKDYGHLDWDRETSPEALSDCIDLALNSIVFGGNYYDLPPTNCWLVWDKLNGKSDFADVELAWTSLDGAARLKQFPMAWASLRNSEPRNHPTQKPLEVITWCLSFVPDAQTVLDPFAGSGTTGRACKDLGKQCVLIEQVEEYCEISAKRMAQEVLL